MPRSVDPENHAQLHLGWNDYPRTHLGYTLTFSELWKHGPRPQWETNCGGPRSIVSKSGETAELLPGSVTTVTLRKPVLKPNECLSIPQLRGEALISATWRECHSLS